MDSYDRLKIARSKGRKTAIEYIKNIFTDFVELSGDRCFGEDKAIIAGIARLGTAPVTVVATEKGKTTNEKIQRNFGSAHPEGYRKALRQMKLAEKFSRPVICFVDTTGAFPGVGAEQRGQGHAIAQNLMEMMTLNTPIISIFIGEGGSGGALALAVADEVWMLENSVYSVIAPEGCASILWKDASKIKDAANSLKLSSYELLKLKVVEKVIKEPANFKNIYAALKADLIISLKDKMSMDKKELLQKRYQRFRKIGAV